MQQPEVNKQPRLARTICIPQRNKIRRHIFGTIGHCIERRCGESAACTRWLNGKTTTFPASLYAAFVYERVEDFTHVGKIEKCVRLSAREFIVAYDRWQPFYRLDSRSRSPASKRCAVADNIQMHVGCSLLPLEQSEDGAAQAPDGAAWEIIGRLIGSTL